MIESVVTDHGVLHEDLLVGPYLVAFINSKSDVIREERVKGKTITEEKKKRKMGRKRTEKNHQQQSIRKTNKYLAISGGSSIRLFLQ